MTHDFRYPPVPPHSVHAADRVGVFRSNCTECQQTILSVLESVAKWCDYCGALVRWEKYKDHRFTHGIVDLPDDPDT